MIRIKLYGNPLVEGPDGVKTISLKKSEAVLYYIVYKERVTRDEVIHMIWPDVEVTTAKKNLRNCLYRLKKDLDVDVFVCPNKNTIHINRDLITSDVWEKAQFLTTFKGRFLENFALADSLSFEEWVREIEQVLCNDYMLRGEETLGDLLKTHQLEEAIALMENMRLIDPYDEGIVRKMLEAYSELSDYTNVINLYQNFKQGLDEAFGIAPDRQTTLLFNTLIKQRQDKPIAVKTIFGRVDESSFIINGIKKRLEEPQGIAMAYVIKGEAGIGKTALSESVVSHFDVVFETSCYQFDTPFGFKAWNDIMSEISKLQKSLGISINESVKQVLAHVFPGFVEDAMWLSPEQMESVQYSYIEKVVCNLFNEITKKQPLIFKFEDLQWMDAMGLKLLSAVLLHCKRIVVIASMRNEISNEVDQLLQTLNHYKKLEVINLNRFEKEAAFEFMSFLSSESLSDEMKHKIYEESEGNAFFIVEMLKLEPEQQRAFDKKLSDLLGARFIGLSEEAIKVSHLIALFFDGVTFDLLSMLYAKDQEKLLEMLEVLKNKYLIIEQVRDGLPFYTFTHHKLRVYLYENMGVAKRNILHHRAADHFKGMLGMPNRDLLIYQKLIYHYRAADDVVMHLNYYLSYLEKYFDVSHEMYPEVTRFGLEPLDDQPELCFSELNQLVQKSQKRHLDIDGLIGRYHLLYGRYLIRQGYYEVGLSEIKSLLAVAKGSSDPNLLYKGYVQWVYYAIQVGDANQLHKNIEKLWALKLSESQTAIVTRFEGIHFMMTKSFEASRDKFKASIEILEALNDLGRYALNIAAAFNYIADSYRYEENYQEALTAVQKAIEICDDNKLARSKAIFYTNAGVINFLYGKINAAKVNFENALDIYERTDVLWRRGSAEAYMGLVALEKGDVLLAKRYLKDAAKHAVMINNPETQEVIYTLEAAINDKVKNH